MAATWLPNTGRKNTPRIVHGVRPRTKGVVIHTIEGSDEGAISWFDDPDAGGVGAQVVIGHTPPSAIQLCSLDALVYHAKSANSDYIGFEHEGKASDSRKTWVKRRTQRKLSANRVAWICWHYQLGRPKKGVNVFGHVDFPAGGHHDPGTGWPWDLFMAACRRAYDNLVASDGARWTKGD